MAVYSLNIPQQNLFADAGMGSPEQVKIMLREGVKKYGNFFQFAAENSKLPVEMLMAFAAVESGIGRNIGGAGHPTRGIMQWNRAYAKTQLENELALGRMTPAEKDKLAEFGIKFDAKGKTRVITEADQIKPELNILIGSILLGQLADSYLDGLVPESPAWATENGVIRLDRMIAVYNAGAYGKTGKAARFGGHPNAYQLAETLKTNGNNITPKYISRLMGKGGYYDLLMTDLKGDVTTFQPRPETVTQGK
jgi:hypothetical protein